MNILPGWFPAGAAIGKAGPTLAFRASATDDNNDGVLTIPASVEAGDLMLLVQMGNDDLAIEPIPSGFTNISSFTSGNERHQISYKIAEEGDASTGLTVGTSGNDHQPASALAAISGGIAAATVNGLESDSSSNDAADPQTTNSSTGQVPFVAFGVMVTGGGNGIINPEFTPSSDGNVEDIGFNDTTEDDDGAAAIYWRIFNRGDTPEDMTADHGDGGNENRTFAFWIELE